jgi:hypothetical protein
MELSVSVEGDDAISDAESLKNFLENRSAKGLNGVEMARSEHKAGEQGLGSFLGKLLLKLAGGDEVIKGIVTLLNTWAEQHDKRIHLPNGVIIPANTLSPEQIVDIVTKLKGQ